MKSLLLLLVLIISHIHLNAQCGTDQIHNYYMEHDASYRTSFETQQDQLRMVLDYESHKQQVITIPVVFHVIHLGEPEGMGSNITDTQINDALQGLNDRFRNVGGIGIDTEIAFCLATRDPSGCPTDGINRINGSGVSDYITTGAIYDGSSCSVPANDLEIKQLSRWDRHEYYNVWVVHDICGFIVGYADFPNTSYGESDGTVIKYSHLSSQSNTLAHELGHGFNLYHTFEGSTGSNCPAESDCALGGDQVCDTPPHPRSGCTTNPCSTDSPDNALRNYMSYCFFRDRFTQGQKDRMKATFVRFPRWALLNSQGCSEEIPLSIQEVSCTDICDGEISLNASCYDAILWSTGETGSTITGLCSGNYSVTVSSSYGTAIGNVSISNPQEMSVTETVVGPACHEGATGSITLEISGGTPITCADTSIIDSDPVVFIPSATYLPAPYGGYRNSAKQQFLYLASELYGLGFQKGEIHALSLKVVSVPGNPVYDNFHIDLGETNLDLFGTGPYEGIEMIRVLESQTTTVTAGWNQHVFDTPFAWNGIDNVVIEFCFTNTSASLNAPCEMEITPYHSARYVSSLSSSMCERNFGFSTTVRPRVRLEVCHDTIVYPSLWNTGETSYGLTELEAGNYTITVTDLNNCQEVIDITLSEPNEITSQTSGFLELLCAGDDNGEIQMSTSGGTPPYAYQWSTGESTVSITGLSVGLYAVSITDSNLCSITEMVHIEEPDSLNTLPVVRNSCSPCDGQIDLYLSGGVAPYSILWMDGQTGNTISSLCDGLYEYTMTDNNGCSLSDSIEIEQLTSPIINVSATVESLCLGESTGLLATGGTSYQWLSSSNLTNDTIANPIATPNVTTWYFVTVTGSNGCSNLDSILIEVHELPIVDAGMDNTIQSGDTIIIGGNPTTSGIPPFIYLWEPSDGLSDENLANPYASPDSTEIYTISVTDGNGCVMADEVEIVVNPTVATIDYIQRGTFVVMPTITQDQVLMEGRGFKNGSYSLEIYSILGELIYHQPLTIKSHAFEAVISFEGYSSGMYLVVLSDREERYMQKVIKMQ